MAISRKPPTGKAKPTVIEAQAETLAVSAPVAAETAIPALQTSLSAADEMQDQVRRQADQGVEQTRLIFEKLKSAAEEASATVETSLSTMSKGVSDIHLKALEALKANSEAHFAYMKALLTTTSITEAITLHGEHAKTSFATLNEQAKEIAALIQQVSAESVEPIKASLAKTFQAAA